MSAGAALLALACGSGPPPPKPPPAAQPVANAPVAPAPPPPAPASAPAGAVPAGWHAVETNAFALAFPAAPTREDSVEDTDVGPSPTTMYSLEIGGSWLGLSVNDFPAGTVASADPGEVLAGARDGALGNVAATLVADRPVVTPMPGSTRTVPGLEYEGQSPEFDINARMFLHGDRLYQLILVVPRGQPAPQLYQDFVATFRLR